MASKLEKAQNKYEELLRQLGEKAEMLDVLDKGSPTVFKKYKRAKQAIGDRTLELEFLIAEIEDMNENQGQSLEALDAQVEQVKSEIEKKEKVIEVKKSKAAPIKTKLAGAEYDFKFLQKALEDEQRKAKQKKEMEDFKRAKEHEATVKRMKIDVLKRKKAMQEMKQEIREYENPVKSLTKEIEEHGVELAKLEENLGLAKEGAGGGLLEEMERQRQEKERELRRAEMHLLDLLADLGEDLFERRVNHPVLNKYYADLDLVAETIDSLQK